jgi:hypothetical protein
MRLTTKLIRENYVDKYNCASKEAHQPRCTYYIEDSRMKKMMKACARSWRGIIRKKHVFKKHFKSLQSQTFQRRCGMRYCIGGKEQ